MLFSSSETKAQTDVDRKLPVPTEQDQSEKSGVHLQKLRTGSAQGRTLAPSSVLPTTERAKVGKKGDGMSVEETGLKSTPLTNLPSNLLQHPQISVTVRFHLLSKEITP